VGQWLGDKLRLVRELPPSGDRLRFEAENAATLRHVTVELLPGERALSLPRAEAFLREARAGARVHHPNVLDVFDLGEDGETGALFVVKERLRGATLDALLEARGHRGLTATECAGIVLPIAEALEASHLLGLSHGAVSASCVLLAERGGFTVPKLLDLGVAGGDDTIEDDEERARYARAAEADLRAVGGLLRDCLGAGEHADGVRRSAQDDALGSELAAIAVRAFFAPADGGFASMTDLVRALRSTRAHARHVADAGDVPILALERSSAPPPLPHAPSEDATGAPERLAWAPPVAGHAPVMGGAERGRRGRREGRARFGLLVEDLDRAQRHAIKAIRRAVRGDVSLVTVPSHARLVDALADGEIDLAWLPPVTYVRARRAGAARLLFTVERDGLRSYSAALVVRRDLGARSVRELSGLRAAWVSPWSAAGFLIPRRMLRGAGVEPDAVFHSQAALGSYEQVLRALVDGEADVGATWCRLGARGEIASSAFADDPRLRVLAVSADAIPGDTICASTALAPEVAHELAARFGAAAASLELTPHFRALLAKDRLVAANPSRYEGLEQALDEDLNAGAAPPQDSPLLARRITAAWEAAG
jgi:phosphate/phosphite/phosphonate ABC transporter binding protein